MSAICGKKKFAPLFFRGMGGRILEWFPNSRALTTFIGVKKAMISFSPQPAEFFVRSPFSALSANPKQLQNYSKTRPRALYDDRIALSDLIARLITAPEPPVLLPASCRRSTWFTDVFLPTLKYLRCYETSGVRRVNSGLLAVLLGSARARDLERLKMVKCSREAAILGFWKARGEARAGFASLFRWSSYFCLGFKRKRWLYRFS